MINQIKIGKISKSFPVNMRDDVISIINISYKYMPLGNFFQLIKDLDAGLPLDKLKSNVYMHKIKKCLFLYKDDYLYLIGKCGEKMMKINYFGFLKEVLNYLSGGSYE